MTLRLLAALSLSLAALGVPAAAVGASHADSLDLRATYDVSAWLNYRRGRMTVTTTQTDLAVNPFFYGWTATLDMSAAFARLQEVAARIRDRYPRATVVSAGMSGDLEAAVERGATHLRLGTALLGNRGPIVG